MKPLFKFLAVGAAVFAVSLLTVLALGLNDEHSGKKMGHTRSPEDPLFQLSDSEILFGTTKATASSLLPAKLAAVGFTTAGPSELKSYDEVSQATLSSVRMATTAIRIRNDIVETFLIICDRQGQAILVHYIYVRGTEHSIKRTLNPP